ncbi:MAG: penicillin acylase family protein [Candidatus Latescibacterota bacterium]
MGMRGAGRALLGVGGGRAGPALAGRRAGDSVDLVRDTWGTPHLFAATDAAALYGLGYATAEDRGFQMHYQLRMIQGRAAAVLGDVALVQPRGETALSHDRRMRILGLYRVAQEVAARLDAGTRGLLLAYSQGVNDYYLAHAGRLHSVYGRAGLRPEPWTVADCIASWWQVGQFFGTDGTRDLAAYHDLQERAPSPDGAPADDAAAVVQRADVRDEWVSRVDAYLRAQGYDPQARPRPAGDGELRFSHAWVVGGGRSTTGAAVLVSDPQTAVTNPSLFYEFHVRGGTFDARGIGVPGSPLMLIGFSAHVAWGMTALGADQADLFMLETDPAHPDQYRFDGQWRDMEVWVDTIRVKGGEPVEVRLRRTHLGPVVTELASPHRGDPEVALARVPGWERDRDAVQASFAMLRAHTAAQFGEALAGWRFPSVNVVFGDCEGHIGYWAALALPLRSPAAPAGGSAAQEGTGSEHVWRDIVPHDLLPHVLDPLRGCLYSANHRPIASFYRIPLGTSTGGSGHTVRSWRLRELLLARERFAPEEVLAVHQDAVNPARRDIVRLGYHLRDVLGYPLAPEALQALGYLEDWFARGGAADLNVAGAEVAALIGTQFRAGNTELALTYGGGESGLVAFLTAMERRLQADAAAALEPAAATWVEGVLSGAWKAAQGRYGRRQAAWPQQARDEVTRQELAYFEGLHGFPALDPARGMPLPALTTTDGGTIRSQRSQAYTQFVPLHDVDQALSLLPPGPTEDPASPFYGSTVALWGSGQLHPAPLGRAAVEEHLASRQTLRPSGTAVLGAAPPAPPLPGLQRIYPNPFNAATTIEYSVAGPGRVRVEVLSPAGQTVRVWVRRHAAAGICQLPWDGRDQRGRQVASGTYVCRVEAEGRTQQQKVTLVR